MKRFVVALAFAAGLCATQAAATEMLPGSEWAPTELNSETFEPTQDIFLRFDSDGRYFGSGGCNTYRGQFVTNGDAILLSPAAATMMACPQEVMDQEYQFFQALMAVRQFERNETDLALSDADGSVILRFVQRDAD